MVAEITENVPTNALELAENLIRNCYDCPLNETRTNAVPGSGPIDAEVVFIAEGPGHNEDEQGKPFVGQAGKFLDELLPMAGLSRDDVYITNMIKCRAPENRDPAPEEIQACSKHLERQLGIIKPKLVVTLGKFSTGKFLPGETIGKARGRLRNSNGTMVYPIMHPAAGLRRGEFKEKVINDFKAIPLILKQIEDNPPELEKIVQPKPKPVKKDPNQNQTTLF